MKSWSIRNSLMASVAVTVLILVAIHGVFNYLQARSSLADTVNDRIVRTGQDTGRFVGNWVDIRGRILDAAANALRRGDPTESVIAQGQASGDFMFMYVGTGDGDMIMHPTDTLPPDFDPTTRPWFTQAQSLNRQIITPPYTDASSGDLVLSFAQPVGGDVIAADVALTEIVEEVLSIRLGDSGYAALLDGDNDFLVHPNEQRLGNPLSALINGGQVSTSPTPLTVADQAWLGAAYPVAGTDWRVLLMVRESEAFGDLGMLAVSNLLVSALTILIVTVVTGFIIARLLKPLRELDSAMSDIAQGEADLTQRLDVVREDEIGSLSRHFNQFIESIHGLVSSSLESSKHLAKLSESARDNANQNNKAVQNQQSEISQVAAAINQMSSTSAEVASNASYTAEAAQTVSDEGQKGMSNASQNKKRMGNLTEQIEKATGVIGNLDEQALQINTILSTIQNIAEQTNLLALNAAIEAARAGEQGRGFAVVADEVRALSKRTHDATGEIQNMIETLQEQTRNAVSIMETSQQLTRATATGAGEVTGSLTSIAQSISDISEQARNIAEASREQNTATEEISRIATAIQDASDQLAHNIDQATAQSDELHDLSTGIRESLTRFKI